LNNGLFLLSFPCIAWWFWWYIFCVRARVGSLAERLAVLKTPESFASASGQAMARSPVICQ
jgi:hypothetical protein